MNTRICLNRIRGATVIAGMSVALVISGCGSDVKISKQTSDPGTEATPTSPSKDFVATLSPDDTDILVPPGLPSGNGLGVTVTENEIVQLTVQKLEQQVLAKAAPRIDQVDRMVCKDPYRVCLSGQWEIRPELRVKKTKEKFCTRESEPHCTYWQGTVNPKVGGPLKFPDDKDHPCFKYTPKQMKCSPPVAGRCVTFGTTCLEHKEVEVEKPVLGPWPAAPESLLGVRIEGDKPKQTDTHRWVCNKISEDLCPPGKWVNQFVRIATFASLKTETTYEPVAVSNELLERLASQLVLRTQNKAPVENESSDCRVELFSPGTFEPNQIAFRLRNVAGCALFHFGNQAGPARPSVSLLSLAHQREPWPCGLAIDSWDGTRSYRCVRPDGQVDTKVVALPEKEATKEKPFPNAYTTEVFPRLRATVRIRFIQSSDQKETSP